MQQEPFSGLLRQHRLTIFCLTFRTGMVGARSPQRGRVESMPHFIRIIWGMRSSPAEIDVCAATRQERIGNRSSDGRARAPSGYGGLLSKSPVAESPLHELPLDGHDHGRPDKLPP